MKRKPFVLIILDGFAFSASLQGNAIAHAKKPFIEKILKNYPYVLLAASGKAVGLMDNQPGNSEVGHLTIGAGKRIESDLVTINKAIEDESFFVNSQLKECFSRLSNGATLHIMGLISDGRVHSYLPHVKALLKATRMHGIKKVMIHAFLDGRDTPAKSAADYLKEIDAYCTESSIGTLASLHGRYYAMDRDLHWERTEETYTALTQVQSARFQNWQAALNYFYTAGITDEFVPPTQLDAMECIKKNDGIFFINYRADRARQLTRMFLDPHFNAHERKIIPLSFFCTMTNYGLDLPIRFLYEKQIIKDTLKEKLSQLGKKVFTIAETEKYAHVTYFFDGHKEEPVKNETRVLVPSFKERSFADNPCMSAPLITQKMLEALDENAYDFYLVNYANADMVGHSGDFNATVQAIECLDEQLKLVWQSVQKLGGTLCITGDHGKAEEMIDLKTGLPLTSHTANPVYFICVSDAHQPRSLDQLHELADIAPWIIKALS